MAIDTFGTLASTSTARVLSAALDFQTGVFKKEKISLAGTDEAILFSKEEKIPNVGQTRVVRKVDGGRFEMICAEKKCKEEDGGGKLREGDVVSIRRIYIDDNVQSQELMAYSCIALQKAYFWSIDGLRSSEYYESSLIVGIGVWENARSAFALVDPRGPGCPGELIGEI